MLVFSFAILFLVDGIFSRDAITNWVQEPIQKFAVNFRTLNGTHKFGSSTDQNGVCGVIQMVSSLNDVDWVVNKGGASPYIAVLFPHLFTNNVMDNLIKSGKISGVVLVMGVDEIKPNNMSFDSSCPNQNIENACNVNPHGDSFLTRDWPIPLTLVDNAVRIKALNDCFVKFNLPMDETQLSRPLCSLHMNNHMFAAVNSEVCMRRSNYGVLYPFKYCEPLGGQNIFLPMGKFWKKEKETIIVSARLDVVSIFDGIGPGAMASITGFVVLLTTAHILKEILPHSSDYKKSVVFTLLNGEAYDFIGSSRVVYDMEKELFPPQGNILKIENLHMFIDISQLNNENVFLHTKNENNLAISFLNALKHYGEQANLVIKNISMSNYLSTSFHSFLKASPKLPGIFISNFQDQFKNRYYHGLYDTSDNIGYTYLNDSKIEKNTIQSHLADMATALALSLYEHLMGEKYNRTLNTYAYLTDELLHCYLDTYHCKYMKAALFKEKIKEETESLYVSVIRGSEVPVKLTGRLLAFLASPTVNISMEHCTTNDSSKSYSYIWMNGLSGEGICVNSTVLYSSAVSPAFDIEDYNWTSGEYSTWTESAWLDLDLYMFMKPPQGQELVSLFSGMFILLSSFIIVYFVDMNVKRRRPSPPQLPDYSSQSDR